MGAAYPQGLIDGFNKAMEDAGLKDLDLCGHPYTWECGRGTEAWSKCHLDRAMVSSTWCTLFPLTKLYNLEGSPSDHSPIFLEPKTIQRGKNKKWFRFENAWLLEPLCYQIVKDNWEGDVDGDIMQKIL